VSARLVAVLVALGVLVGAAWGISGGQDSEDPRGTEEYQECLVSDWTLQFVERTDRTAQQLCDAAVLDR
jgi:hypothetical protein